MLADVKNRGTVSIISGNRAKFARCDEGQNADGNLGMRGNRFVIEVKDNR